MAGKQINSQGEAQLVAEWAATLPAAWKWKMRVNVGAQQLQYAGMPLTPKQQMAFGVWNDWADLRVATPNEVWIVEGKLVATGNAYGQVLDYVAQYPESLDYQQFAPRPIVPVVLTMAARARTSAMFANLGVRTIIFSPSFPFSRALQKLFPAAQILYPETASVIASTV
jgi:hypothetical protein